MGVGPADPCDGIKSGNTLSSCYYQYFISLVRLSVLAVIDERVLGGTKMDFEGRQCSSRFLELLRLHWPPNEAARSFSFGRASLIAFSLQFVSVVLVVVDGKVFPSLLLPVLPVFQLNGEIQRRKHIVSN